MKKQFNRAMHRLYACVLATATSFSLNAQCTGLLTNNGFESSGGATFGSTFQGNPAEPINQGSTIVPGFTADYNCNGTPCQPGYWINDVNNTVNNPEGSKFIWLPQSDYRLKQTMTLTSGMCVQVCFSAASWAKSGIQDSTEILVEMSTPGNPSLNSMKSFHLPASTSWNNLNWQSGCVTFSVFTPGSYTLSVSAGGANSRGIAIDNICLAPISCPVCQTISNPSQPQSVCSGNQGNNITVNANHNAANTIKFVRFASHQNNPVAIYNNGTQIGPLITPSGSFVPYTATYTYNPNDFPNTGNSNITYYVYAILGTDLGPQCKPYVEIPITVKPHTPPIVNISNSAICLGVTATLTASGGNSYLWSTGETTATIHPTPTSNTIYSVTSTAVNGCQDAVQQTINVNSVNAQIAGMSSSVCVGSPVNISVIGGTGYIWSTGETTASITPTPTSTTTYEVSVTDANGCSKTLNSTVPVIVPPALAGSPNVTPPACGGNTGNININATGVGTIEYSIDGGFTWQTSNIFLNQPTGTYSVYLRTQENTACVNTSAPPAIIPLGLCGDFTPTIEIDQPTFFNNSGPHDFLVSISEIGNTPSNGPIVLKIIKINGFTYSFSSTTTLSNVNGGTLVDNANWIKTENSAFITLTLNSNYTIPGYGVSIIGMTVSRNTNVPPQTYQPITVTVVSGSAGDVNTLNNSYNLIIKAQ